MRVSTRDYTVVKYQFNFIKLNNWGHAMPSFEFHKTPHFPGVAQFCLQEMCGTFCNWDKSNRILRWSTCHLRFFSWLLHQMICLKLSKEWMLLLAEQLTKCNFFHTCTTKFKFGYYSSLRNRRRAGNKRRAWKISQKE